MGSQDITHNSTFYVSLGVQALIAVVLLGLVIVGIAIAVRAKTGTGKGCGIVMTVALCLAILPGCTLVCGFLLPRPGIEIVGWSRPDADYSRSRWLLRNFGA